MNTLKNLNFLNVLTVAWFEFIKTVKSPTFLILTFVMPLIMIVIGGIGFVTEHLTEEQEVKLAIIDETQELYPLIERQAEGSSLMVAEYNPGSEEMLEQEVLEGKYDAYVVLNEESIMAGHIPLYTEDIRNIHPNMIRGELTAVLTAYRLYSLGLTDEQISAVNQPVNIDVQSIAGEELEIADFLAPLIMGVVLIFAVIFSGQVMMYGVIKEKQNRIVEILLSSVSSIDLLMGKIIGYGFLSLAQIAIWVVVGLVVATRFFDVSTLDLNLADFIVPFLIFLFGYLMLASMFATVGATMKEAEGGSQMHGLFILIPMIPMFISAHILMTPNALWVRILSHVPPFIPVTALMRLGGTTLPSWEIGTILLASIVSVGIFICGSKNI